jgi:hypothetical protein
VAGESAPFDGRHRVAPGDTSFDIIPGRAKAFHAKAQSRGAHKEDKAIVRCGLCALAFWREIVYFSTPAASTQLYSFL